MTSPRETVSGQPTEVNPRQANRARNWFSAPWNLPVFTADYNFSEHTKATLKLFGLVGERNSVGNLSAVTNPDVTRLTTGRTTGFEMEDAFSPRQIDRDYYRNYGAEARFVTSYKLLDLNNTSSFGVRHSIGNTDRFRNLNGTRGQDFTLHETNRVGDFLVRNADLKFRTSNYAVFYEHLVYLTEKWSVAPGVRYEIINGEVSGHRGIDNLNRASTPISFDNRTTPFNIAQPQKITNTVILGGIGTQYKVYKETNLHRHLDPYCTKNYMLPVLL
jgi:Fe(3+) dicitrate transport protein